MQIIKIKEHNLKSGLFTSLIGEANPVSVEMDVINVNSLNFKRLNYQIKKSTRTFGLGYKERFYSNENSFFQEINYRSLNGGYAILSRDLFKGHTTIVLHGLGSENIKESLLLMINPEKNRGGSDDGSDGDPLVLPHVPLYIE